VDIPTFITDFADQAVILPFTAIVGIGLALAGWYRGAAAWVLAIAATLAFMLVLKIACLACGSLIADGLHSPSGHTAASAAALGGFAGLAMRLRTGEWRWTVPLASAVAIVIGLSRLALHVHTVLEVALAGAVGVLGASALVLLAGRPPRRLRVAPLLGAAIATVVLLHGVRLPAEGAIKDFAALHLWPLSACKPAFASLD